MNSTVEAAVTIGSLILGIAALSVILAPKATTTAVIQSTASGFSNALATAMSPVTGAQVSINTSYPSSTIAGVSSNIGSPTYG